MRMISRRTIRFQKQLLFDISDTIREALEKIKIPMDYVESLRIRVHKPDEEESGSRLLNVKVTDKVSEQYDLFDA